MHYSTINHFWFVETKPQQRFQKSQTFDQSIKHRFASVVEQALANQLDHWSQDVQGTLTLIIVLDQFTRNIYRDSPMAFAGDSKALALSLQVVEQGILEKFDSEQRQFVLMPMMHSEDLDIQQQSLPLFQQYTHQMVYDYAVKHRDIIAMFGRFPHRNAILNRSSTTKEKLFLLKPNSGF